ncbi:MAG: aspartate kinase [Chitinophagaceae bacterium]|nr:aspartate kinase [Chitinophagaceae bacterium]MCW5927133.1 aspartate kinase [Chitinophagaceae bacterium]
MQVFKLGGASVNSVDRIKHAAGLLEQYQQEKLLVVISAMGKTTNALEKVTEAFYKERKEEALALFEQVKQNHINTAKYLLVTHFNETLEQLFQLFTEVEWALHDKPVRDFDYYYDQIVCCGELLSTTIISAYLNERKLVNKWIDIRDILRTNNNFRIAGVDETVTLQNIETHLLPCFEEVNMVVTQGFIGATDENETTTLGREGSDFTAAVMASLLKADSVTIWKDVEGVMSADPKLFPDARLIEKLSYDEVIEMAYYGAQVIHPKTIKPLRNEGIPLFVKCFFDTSLPGTVIHNKSDNALPPIIVVKPDQVLLHLQSGDFSFVGEKEMSGLYQLLKENKERANIIQTGAVGLMLCVDDKGVHTDELAAAASALFEVQVERGLTLLTIRHFTPEVFENLTAGKQVVLRQQTAATIQVLVR